MSGPTEGSGAEGDQNVGSGGAEPDVDSSGATGGGANGEVNPDGAADGHGSADYSAADPRRQKSPIDPTPE